MASAGKYSSVVYKKFGDSLAQKLSEKTSILSPKLYFVVGLCVSVSIGLLIFVFLRSNRNSMKSRPVIPETSEIIEIKTSDGVENGKISDAVKEEKGFGSADADKVIDIGTGSEGSNVSGSRQSSTTAVSVEVPIIGWGRLYTVSELEIATSGFSKENVIREGGYGVVYRGVLPDSSVVAVKNLLNKMGQAEKEFKVEVEALGKVRHKNLVDLIGYCADGAQRMLVYEYIDNGNLEQWLHGDVGPVSPLTWDIRMKIAVGIAKGLAYLHEGLEPRVVHRDIKSSNILLDKNWNAKVSNFGLAKLLGSDARHVAPEYANTGMLPEGSDLYNFGVLLMEIISGRSPVDSARPVGEVNLVDWFKVMVLSRRGDAVVDPLIEVQPSTRALNRALLLCLCCINLDANKGTKMGQVVHMLEGDEFPFPTALINQLAHPKLQHLGTIDINYCPIIQGCSNVPISSGMRGTVAILDTSLIQALLLTGQSSATLELLQAPNHCDVKICEEFLRERNCYTALLELYKCNGMHHEALKLLNQLVDESNSDQLQSDLTQKFTPDMIIEYLKPLCSTDPMLVLEYSMLVLESCPTQTIELFLSGNVPADLVNSYLKQHAPSLQITYLELMHAMKENRISENLLNEMVQIYLSKVLDLYDDLKTQKKWDEKVYSPTREKLLSALENISGYNSEGLLKRLPANALFEERAILLGKMNQHQLALSLYVHKLHVPELALAYCDRVYDTGQHQPRSEQYSNIYLTLLQIYLNPQRTTKELEKKTVNLVSSKTSGIQKVGSVKAKDIRVNKKIAEIACAEDIRISPSSTDRGRSNGDGDEGSEEGGSVIMIDEVLDLLIQRRDRINGAQALKLLPRETKLQNWLPFLETLLKKTSESQRNLPVIKSLSHSENLQVKDKLYEYRRTMVKISSDSMCSLCNKRIGTSAFAVYPNGKTLVHFLCFRDSQGMKTVVKGLPLRKAV